MQRKESEIEYRLARLPKKEQNLKSLIFIINKLLLEFSKNARNLIKTYEHYKSQPAAVRNKANAILLEKSVALLEDACVLATSLLKFIDILGTAVSTAYKTITKHDLPLPQDLMDIVWQLPIKPETNKRD